MTLPENPWKSLMNNHIWHKHKRCQLGWAYHLITEFDTNNLKKANSTCTPAKFDPYKLMNGFLCLRKRKWDHFKSKRKFELQKQRMCTLGITTMKHIIGQWTMVEKKYRVVLKKTLTSDWPYLQSEISIRCTQCKPINVELEPWFVKIFNLECCTLNTCYL